MKIKTETPRPDVAIIHVTKLSGDFIIADLAYTLIPEIRKHAAKKIVLDISDNPTISVVDALILENILIKNIDNTNHYHIVVSTTIWDIEYKAWYTKKGEYCIFEE